MSQVPSFSITEARSTLGEQWALGRARLSHARAHLLDRESLVQAGQTPFETLWSDGQMALRYYPPLTQTSIRLADGQRCDVARQTQRTPLVIVPPLAVNNLVYDLFPDRSVVRYLRARGFELYLVDWGDPGLAQNRLSLSDYFARLLPAMLARVRAHSGARRLSLHGWSLGGLFSLCQAALADDDDIANLVLIGAPVDYHDNGALGARYREISRRAGWLHDTIGLSAQQLPAFLLRSPGWLNSLVFKATSPWASIKSYVSLVRNLHDGQAVRAHATNGAFLDNMVAYPGAAVADFIDYLWVDNVMADGRLPMADATATLADVRAPILNITGRGDPIVTPECSQAMTRLVSSTDITCRTLPGGHVGIVSSSEAQHQSWGMIADWLIARD